MNEDQDKKDVRANYAETFRQSIYGAKKVGKEFDFLTTPYLLPFWLQKRVLQKYETMSGLASEAPDQEGDRS